MLPRTKPALKPIYLDHAATTPVDSKVEVAMRPFGQQRYGNPSSLYKQGVEAARALNQARADIGAVLRCKPQEIVFTAGGTESVNLAVFGVARAFELAKKRKGHLICSTIEHHSVLHSVEALQQEGWQVSLIPVDAEGFIRLDKLKAALRDNTVLISVMYANNEIGTVEPIAEIGKWLRLINNERLRKKLPQIYFHTDACQAAGALDIDVGKLGADLFSLNGSKIYGPKQTGLLYVKTGTKLRPLIFGGGQEKNLRSGTENVAGAVGLAKALTLVQSVRLQENQRLLGLRDYFHQQLQKRVPGITLNGPEEKNRLPNNVNVSIKDVEGEALLLYLDSYNVAVSTGSACTTTETDPSHVLLALRRSAKEAYSSVRFSFGHSTTKKELDYVLSILPGIVAELRGLTNS